jgi:DNA-binding PadR family transcriptional regulator
MDLLDLEILSLLALSELSGAELSEMTEAGEKRVKVSLRRLEHRGLIYRKAFTAGDVVFAITEDGLESLARDYRRIRDLLSRIEEGVCLRMEC